MKKKQIVFIAACFLILFVGYQCSSDPVEGEINITDPSKEATVDHEQIVKGKVNNPRLTVYVLVHPLKTNKWWVQNIPAVDAKGDWQTLCYFGSQTEGNGEPFEVIALADHGSGALKTGSTIEVLPSKLLRSQVVTVKRR